MEKSYNEKSYNIEAILASLTTNRVSIPISENEYSETIASMYQKKKDPFADMDDMLLEFKNFKSERKNHGFTTSNRAKVVDKPKEKDSNRGFQKHNIKMTLFEKLLYAIHLVKENALQEFLCCSKTQTEVDGVIQSCRNHVQGSINCMNAQMVLENGTKLSKKKLQSIIAYMFKPEETVLVEPTNEDLVMLLSFIANVVESNLVFRLVEQKEIFIDVKSDYPVVIVKVEEVKSFPSLVEKTTRNDYRLLKERDTLKRLRQDVALLQNLKSLTVKDLRQIAVDIGIQLEDSTTHKLLSKVELRQQIEAKFKETEST